MKKLWNNFFSTQFLGVFNDNILKNLICFVAISWAPEEQKSLVISLASAMMVLPFILLSPLAGRLSQNYLKSKVLSRAKFAEIPIMLIASAGFYFDDLVIVMISMFLMGVQSALYSPSKYGLIKVFSANNKLSSKLGLMEMLSFTGVLLGSLVAGFIADLSSNQFAIITLVLTSVAAIGYITSKSVSGDEQPVFIKKTSINPVKFLTRNYKSCKKNKGVNLSVFGLAIFWFIGSLLQMNILVHCPDAMGFSSTETGLVTAFIAIGIGLGCYVSGKITQNRLEIGLTFFAGLGLSVSLLLLSVLTLNAVAFVSLLMVAAFCGGLFKIPLNAWMQQRTSSEELGDALAYSNMMVFLFILLSAVIFAFLQTFMGSIGIFAFTGVVAFLTVIFIAFKIPVAVVRFFVWTLSKLIFRTRISGKENIPLNGGGLVVCNHVSLLDSLLIVAAMPRNVRYVMHESIYKHKLLNPLFRKCHMIPVRSGKSKEALAEFTRVCKKEVEAGHLVCIFPEGQLSRTGQLMPFKKGIEYLVQVTGAAVIPVHLDNLVGTPLSFKTGTSRKYMFNFKTLQRKVFVRVGKVINQQKTAFELRQVIKELEVENVAIRTKDMSSEEALHQSKIQIHKKGDYFELTTLVRFKDLIMSTPNYLIKDLSGTEHQQVGTKDGAIGKPVPGVTVAVKSQHLNSNSAGGPLNKPWEEGKIFIKHAFSDCVEWVELNIMGSWMKEGLFS